MFSETDMEDLIANDPKEYLGEAGLRLIARQYRIGPYVFDLLFEDRHGGKLIVEIQKGTLDRNHTYKILDYYDEYKEQNPSQFVELMVVANNIPAERRKRLSTHGVSCKEIPKEKFIKSREEKEDKNSVGITPDRRLSPPTRSTPSAQVDSSDVPYIPGYRKEYTVEGLRTYSSSSTWKIFLALRQRILSISNDIYEELNSPHSTKYVTSQIFASIDIKKTKLNIWIKALPHPNDPLNRCKPAPSFEKIHSIFYISDMSELDYAMNLIDQSYAFIKR